MTCTEGRANRDLDLAMESEVTNFLATGESDPLGSAFLCSSTFERIANHARHLRGALLQEIERRERAHKQNHMLKPSIR